MAVCEGSDGFDGNVDGGDEIDGGDGGDDIDGGDGGDDIDGGGDEKFKLGLGESVRLTSFPW